MRLFLLHLGAILVIGLNAAQLPADEPSAAGEQVRGLPKPKAASPARKPYAKTLALVVGVNYKERMDADRVHLPPLQNAERDAQSVYEVLTKLYGFEGTILLGPQATKQAIGKALDGFNNPAKVGPDDAVLFYFSGHGARVADVQERGVIYPYDIEIQQGLPVENKLRLHSDLVDILKNCPARHKLIVLDSCHSGEIFNLDARPFSETSAESEELLSQPTLQAIASCRSSQVASDGLRGENSPFTTVLIRALQRLPAREASKEKSPVPTSRLFKAIRADLTTLRNGQSPDCRSFVGGDGEFQFWPSASADFKPFEQSAEELDLLQAMVPGEYGKWWFDETPWFIPSLRSVILAEKETGRASGTLAINPTSLARVADAALQKMRAEPGNAVDALIGLRVDHYNRLRATTDPQKFRDEAAKIVKELRAPPDGVKLEATDVHLLAVLQHFLLVNDTKSGSRKTAGSPAADGPKPAAAPAPLDLPQDVVSAAAAATSDDPIENYRRALSVYEAPEGKNVALAALCRCDLGNLYVEVKRDYASAVQQYEQALAPFCRDAESQSANSPGPPGERSATTAAAEYQGAPAAFQIYVYCREANAWKAQSKWGRADACFDRALAVAQDFDSNHSLTAAVHNLRAWSFMEQWRINKAVESFDASNRILKKLALDAVRDGIAPADDRPSINAQMQPGDFDEMLKYDYDAVITYLHNMHGFAMAQRFRGQVPESAASYRLITEKLSQALGELTWAKTSLEVSKDVNVRLTDRLINTQERLADCNLFGDPDLRDIKEAADDYRRAIELCVNMPAERRWEKKASLLMRQALALAVESEVQDVEHARFLHDEALAVIAEADPPKKTAIVLNLLEICPAVIRVYESTQPSQSGACVERLACLRKAIQGIVSKDDTLLSRDQLELLLFAAKILVDQAPLDGPLAATGQPAAAEGSAMPRLQAARDADLLLSICRQTLVRGAVATPSQGQLNEFDAGGESRRYLRPYYDSVMNRKLTLAPKHVKELLEVQFEATRGQLYTKASEARPILALYVLEGKQGEGKKGWLFLDVPRGVSMHLRLDGQCSLKALQIACIDPQQRLSLPPQIFKELAALPLLQTWASGDARPAVDCWWLDHVRGLPEDPAESLPVDARTTSTTHPIAAEFPFQLPLVSIATPAHSAPVKAPAETGERVAGP